MSFGCSIGDFLTVTTLAWDTYCALRDASEDFQGFASEVHSLYTALVCLRDEGRSPSSILQYAAPQKIAGLKDVIENCEHSLIGLQKRAKTVCLLQPKQKRQFWQEFKLAFKDKQGPRDRIAIHTASINMFLSSLTHGSLGRLELLLRNALQSSSSGFSTSSTVPRGLGNYTENAWNEIGQDLLMEGISEKHFGTFQNEIKAYMRYLVHGGAPLSETNFRHGCAAMPRSHRESHCDPSEGYPPGIAVMPRRRNGSTTGYQRHEDRESHYDSSSDEFPPGIAVTTRRRNGSTTGHQRHEDRESYYDSSDDEYPPGITVINMARSRHGSITGGGRYPRDHVFPDGSLLSVPSDAGGRHHSSSTGAAPQPQVVNVVVGDRRPERSHKSPERHHKSPERRHKSAERRRKSAERLHKSPERRQNYDRRRGRRRGRSSESVSSEEERRYREHQRRSSKRKSELDAETIVKLDRLKVYEKEEADREYERKLNKEIEIQKAKELYEAEQKAKKQKELQEYVERWKREAEKKEKGKREKEKREKEEKEEKEKEKREKEKREKEKREKEEEDAKFKERFKIQFMQAGYTEAQAEAVLQKKEENEKKRQNSIAIDPSQPTWIKVEDQTEVILQNGEDMILANRPRVSRVQETKRETVDIHDLVHSFDDLFPISGPGLAA